MLREAAAGVDVSVPRGDSTVEPAWQLPNKPHAHFLSLAFLTGGAHTCTHVGEEVRKEERTLANESAVQQKHGAGTLSLGVFSELHAFSCGYSALLLLSAELLKTLAP